ncbi:MAG TPA: helix-turn-helix domain-containing protein [Flavobacteriales bacterium]|nr:helix-turn-helix domain-containing protein [Flavobacteriales bacterium]
MPTRQTQLSVFPLSRKILTGEKFKGRSNNYFIFIFRRGSGRHCINDNWMLINHESVHFVALDLIQKFDGVNFIDGYCIEFSPSLFGRFTLNKEILFDLPFFGYDIERPTYKIPIDLFDELYAMCESMYREVKAAKKWHERIVISFINVLMLKCGQLFHIEKKNEQYYTSGYYGSMQMVEAYRRLIRDNFKKQHFVKFYASQLNQTPNYLNIVVKSVTGKTASSLIHAQLILEAKHLLVQTKLSHKEVAVELGFSDQSYFTRFFKRETGLKPLDWFKANK